MADTYTNLLRLRLQQTGANQNTWGALLNAAAIQLIEDAIAGVANITVAGSNVTLSTANGANDQARMAVLNLTGSPGAARDIIVPALSKPYLVINQTGHTMTVKVAGQTGVGVPNGARQYLYCDGTDVYPVEAGAVGGAVALATNALQLGGVLAANYARKDAFNQHTKGFATTFVALTDASTIDVDCTASNRFRVVLGGDRALTLSNPADGQTIEIWFVQDAGGGRTIAWPNNVRFAAGSSPTLSTGANAIDAYRLTYHDGSDTWVATALRNASQASGATTYDVTVSGGGVDVHLHSLLGKPTGVLTVNVTVEQGVILQALSTGSYGLDTTGFDSGTEINLVNLGYILGRGGRGGRGGHAVSNDYGARGENGEAGGHAIRGPGPGRTLNITNANGFIWGGGGGGGGGGASSSSGSSVDGAMGGGGGGGAGGGLGGSPGAGGGRNSQTANPGSAGSSGVNGGPGLGGSGSSVGKGSGGAGGAGGDWGAAGSSGASPTSFSVDASGGTGGAAGKAVDVNGATVSFVSGSGSPNVKGAVS